MAFRILFVALTGLASLTAKSLLCAQTPNGNLKVLPPVEAPLPIDSRAAEPIPPGAFQNAPAELSLDDLEAMALSENPTVSKLAARVDAARGDWVQAGLPPNPVVGYSASEIGNEGRSGQQGGFVGQEYVTGHKLRLSRDVASQDVRVADATLAAQRLRVVSDVRINYYEVLIAQRRTEVTQNLVDVSQRAAEAAETFLKHEQGNRVDLLQARVEASSASILLENSRNDYLGSWRRLAVVVGAPTMSPARILGNIEANLPEINYDAALERVLAESPELLAAQAGVDRARLASQRAGAERIPNVDLQAGVQHDNASHDDIANVQVGVPLPLWNRNQGGIRRARADVASAQSEVQRVQLALGEKLATVYQRYANAKQQVEFYKSKILPDAKSSLDLVGDGYKQGEFGYLALLTSQRTYFQTSLAYLESLRQLREAGAAIDGMLLSDSLQER